MIEGLPTKVFNKVPITCFKGILNSNLYLVNTEEEWKDIFDVLKRKKLLAVDTETSGLVHYKGNRICGISLGYENDHFYIPTRHVSSVLGGDPPPQLSMDFLRPYLIELFNTPGRSLVFHNAKFDKHFFEVDGIPISCTTHDTRSELHLIDENIPGELKVACSGWTDLMGIRHSGIVHPNANDEKKAISDWRSKEAAARKRVHKELVAARVEELKASLSHQKFKVNDLKAIAKKELELHLYADVKKEDISYDCIPVEDMAQYAALDTLLTWELHKKLYPMLVKDQGKLLELYYNELELNNCLFEIENRGIHIDIGYFQAAKEAIEERIKESSEELQQELGVFNLNSTDQLAKALIAYGVKLTKEADSSTNEKPKYCLDKKEMAKLARRYPIVSKVVAHRKLVKLLTTYIEPILAKHVNGIVYASFNPSVKTGRLSSGGKTSAINFQTLPSGDKTVKLGLIVPSSDYIYFSFDYSQVELRLTAHLSQDPIMLQAYKLNEDLHLKTCCGMFGWDLQETIKKFADDSHPEYYEIEAFRKIAKIINFSAIYGTSGKGLSEQIPRPKKYESLSEEEWVEVCTIFLEKYFDAHRGVAKFLYRAKKEVKTTGQVITELGRIRRLPHSKAVSLTGDRQKAWMESAAERQGGNALVQGLAADIFKYSLVKVCALLRDSKSYVANLVHDSIDGFMHKSELHFLLEIKRIMEDWNFSVKIKADLQVSFDNIGNKVSVKDIPAFIAQHSIG